MFPPEVHRSHSKSGSLLSLLIVSVHLGGVAHRHGSEKAALATCSSSPRCLAALQLVASGHAVWDFQRGG